MAPRPRRLRNLNLDQVADRQAVEDGQDNLPHDDTEESLQGSVAAGRGDREPAADGHANLPENDTEDSSMEIDTDNRHDHLRSNNVDYPTNYEKEVHIQSPTHGDKRAAAADFEGDPILTNMRTRRVKAHIHDASSEMEVYLISLRYKSRVVAKGHLVTSDSRRIIGETRLGSEYVAVRVDSIENVASRNKGDEEIPRPFHSINTLLEAVGYIIAWPRSHVKEVTSSSCT